MARIHHDRLQRLIGHALGNGGTREDGYFNRFRWDISGKCQNGYERVLRARPEARDRTVIPASLLAEVWPDQGPHRDIIMEDRPYLGRGRPEITVAKGTRVPLQLTLVTPCRRCDRCRSARRSLWTFRAKAELDMATRTWFGTLTLAPDEQFRIRTIARAKAAERGEDFEALDYGAQFRRLVSAAGPDITDYLKRIRKNSGATIRYLIVAEAHKSGNPHFHALVHEYAGSVKHRELKRWQRRIKVENGTSTGWHMKSLGFCDWKLASDKASAIYLCKYLAKDAAARVRASQRYGQGPVLEGDQLRPQAIATREGSVQKFDPQDQPDTED